MVSEYGITGMEPYFNIRSRSEIRDSLMKKGVKDRYTIRWDVSRIQKEELQLKLSKLNISSDVVDAVSESLESNRYDYYSINFCKFPFPITSVSDIRYSSQVEPASGYEKYIATIENFNNGPILKIKRNQNQFEFNLITLISEVENNENQYLVSINPNIKAIFLLKNVVVDTQKKRIVSIEGLLCE
jgi:hypothetical protein